MAATFTKLVLRLRALGALPQVMLNRVSADLMLYIVGILRLGDSPAAAHPVDADSVDRIAGAAAAWGSRGVFAVGVGRGGIRGLGCGLAGRARACVVWGGWVGGGGQRAP